jgi:predicted MFS family arabinose efflux permease
VLVGGALLLAGGLLGIGFAPSLPWYLAGWLVIGLGMSAGLYDAAFSTLGTIYGSQSRSAITSLTLFGGFASTVCWPLSAFLAEQLGWRGACFIYAAIQVVIALKFMCWPCRLSHEPSKRTSQRRGAKVRLLCSEYPVFALLAVVLTIGAAILSVMGTHLLLILIARGLDVSVAVGLNAIVGPSQVGARVIEMLAGSRYHPMWTMVASAVLVAIAALMLVGEFPIIAIAIGLYGAGNGIGSIARGTVPLALFGPKRYPVLMGRLALPLLIAMAISPFIGGLAFQKGGVDWVLAPLAAFALANVVLVVALGVLMWRQTQGTVLP